MSDAKAKPRLTALLQVVLLAVSIFAAWQIHLYWFADASERVSPRTPQPGPTIHPALTSDLDLRKLTEAPSAGDWSGAAGLVEMSGDPGEINPPMGAKRRFAFSRVTGDSNEQLARYEYTGSILAAAEHYSGVLTGAGFEVRTACDGDDERLLMASKRMERVVIVLSQSKSSHGKIEISVTLITPHGNAELGGAQ